MRSPPRGLTPQTIDRALQVEMLLHRPGNALLVRVLLWLEGLLRRSR